jgi:N-acetylmuramoyl-L-alanine amidase
MTGLRLRRLLGGILAVTTLSSGGLSVRDTVVNGIPSLRLMDGRGWSGNLKIDSERGELRASLEGAPDSVLQVFDRNPFARMGGLTRPLRFPPRVTKSRLVLPKATASSLLRSMGVARAAADNVEVSKARRKTPETTQAMAKPVPHILAPPILAPTPPAPDTPREAAPTPDTPRVVKPTMETPSSPVVERPSTPSLDTPSTAPVEEATAPSTSVPEAPSTDSVASPSPPSAPEVAEVDETEPPVAAAHKGVFTVVIDAGHGGKDPGARGQKADGTAVLEKMATLQVALKLRDELAGHKGIKVVMTRDKDVFVELSGRTRIANAAKGDLFISLHCNSLPAGSKRRDEVDGFMVYLLREAVDQRDKAIERRENDAINYETGAHQTKEALSPVEWMLLDHQLNLYTKESERFAGLVVRKLQSQGPVAKERTGASQAGFFVLVGALMPSVLIEMGYVSSPADAAALTDPARQKKIAGSIAEAIDQFRAGKR